LFFEASKQHSFFFRYGIGARHAEKAEKVMMDSAKELFAGTPGESHGRGN